MISGEESSGAWTLDNVVWKPNSWRADVLCKLFFFLLQITFTGHIKRERRAFNIQNDQKSQFDDFKARKEAIFIIFNYQISKAKAGGLTKQACFIQMLQKAPCFEVGWLGWGYFHSKTNDLTWSVLGLSFRIILLIHSNCFNIMDPGISSLT